MVSAMADNIADFEKWSVVRSCPVYKGIFKGIFTRDLDKVSSVMNFKTHNLNSKKPLTFKTDG